MIEIIFKRGVFFIIIRNEPDFYSAHFSETG